jgi:lipopolysaccharide assembly protein A
VIKLIYSLIFGLIFIVALLFSFKNLQLVSINLFIGTVQIPLALALTLELLAGVALGLAARAASVFRLKSEIGRLQKALDHVEQELEALRAAFPFKGD